jgi:hypothetical protein
MPAPNGAFRLVLLSALAALAGLVLPAAGQVPGEFPHLVLSSAFEGDVPGPGGPWDNSHVFHAFSGQSFDATISYEAVGQLNTHVFWALLVSATPTPYPTDLVPPQLLTMPPFVLVVPPAPMLSLDGEGSLKLIVPAGLTPVDVYLQGLVYDSTNSPPLQLANGLKLEIQTPDYSVRYAFLRSYPTGDDGDLADAGVIDIDASRLKTLKPLGPNPPPMPVDTETPPPGTTVQVENPIGVPYSFLPILPNVPDAPVNPLARPLTKVVGSVSSTAATITVADTSYFPSRGRLLVALKSSNLWGNRIPTADVPDVEVVHYDGKDATHFFNCERLQVGTQTDGTNVAHVDGEVVAGEFTLATAPGARGRQRVSLDVDNPDLPHVVIPEFTFTPVEGGPAQTRSLDLYLYERSTDLSQGFMLFDRLTGAWTPIAGTLQPPSAGSWDPMVCVAPDNKSFVAVFRDSTGLWGWDNAPDQIWAVRLDGQDWPASSSPIWQITYQLTPDPQPPPDSFVQSRRPIPRCFAIIGPNADNYVLYAGLAHKWAQSLLSPGSNSVAYGGFEAEWIREEVLVKDLIECPLVPPGSSKTPPAMPRPYITAQFGKTGMGLQVVRFDPELVVARDRTRLLLGGGRGESEEDAFVIRNVAVTSGGAVVKTIVNVSGATGQREVRAMTGGGHGQGGKAAFSPGGTRVAFLVRAGTNTQQRDWIDIALASGASFGQVKHVYINSAGNDFKEPGAYQSDRVVSGLRFVDENRLVFMMGRCPYDDPLAVTAANAVAMDWFSYNITTGLMTNLTRSYALTPPPETTFSNLGKLSPGGFFDAPGGEFTYLLRFGGIAATTGSVLAPGTAVSNVLGLNVETLGVFPVTGDEFGDAAVVNLSLPAAECRVPIETPSTMRFVEGTGVQDAMVAFTAHLTGGNESDEVFVLNRDSPFVAVQTTSTGLAGVHVRNVASDPYSGKLAFSRSSSSATGVANEHPFVVDLDNFLFERDLLPTWVVSGNSIGRVMDGSFQFVAPGGSAGEALVFSFGLDVTPGGMAQTAPPAYYALSAVSNPLAEPIPTIIPLVDTQLLGPDFRFYVLAAGPSTGK